MILIVMVILIYLLVEEMYPEIMGMSPSSYIFVNDGKGHFTDIAKTKNPDIANIGMVTGADGQM